MRSSLVAVTVILGLFASLSLVSGQGKPETPQYPTHATKHRKGKPLIQLIHPGQAAVVIEKDQSAPSYVEPPPGTTQLEWMTSLAPFVAIIRIETRVPALTEAQDWIQTSVHARIEDVLKRPQRDPLAVGDAIDFVEDGGDMTIGATRVTTVLPWAHGFREGERYLVFMDRIAAGKEWQVDPGTAYEVVSSNDRLKSLAKRGHARSMSGLNLSEAKAQIREKSNPRK